MLPLEEAQELYTGGLDRSSEHRDGEWVYFDDLLSRVSLVMLLLTWLSVFWEGDFLQVVFHVTTLMPKPQDQSLQNKKRHIGNDYVNIIYSDSPLPYEQNTIPVCATPLL